jgi:hypothetical protein
MPSQITSNRALLSWRHYVVKATAWNHWFNFYASRLQQYQTQYGEDFCLIINGSNATDDAYIIPFSKTKQAFTPDAIDHRGRWVGTVCDDVLRLASSGHCLRLRAFHNAFELLDL